MALAGSGSGSGSGRSGGSGHPTVVLAADRDMIRDDNEWNVGKSDPNYSEIRLKYLECNIYMYIYYYVYIYIHIIRYIIIYIYILCTYYQIYYNIYIIIPPVVNNNI